METKKNSIELILRFEKSFLLSRYRGAWLDALASADIALTPPSSRDPVPGRLGRFVGRLAKSPRRRAQTSPPYCSPEKSEHRREAIIGTIYASTPQAMVMTVELDLRDPQKILVRIDWQGKEVIDEMQRSNGKVIFLAPHAWDMNIPVILMASGRQKMAATSRNQGSPVFNHVRSTACRCFDRRTHACNDGVKPFIQSMRQGCWGYYLPDQGYGAKHSELMDFFATYKVTLPAIGRLMRVCHARVIPLFPVYNGQTYRLTVLVHPSVDDLLDADDMAITRRMDEEVEVFVKPRTEQYTQILRLLKTCRPGRIEPYKHEEPFPRKQSRREPVGVPGSLAILCQQHQVLDGKPVTILRVASGIVVIDREEHVYLLQSNQIFTA